jgi:undecaprenyl phosphate-alpha-L-ara4FN deformylase
VLTIHAEVEGISCLPLFHAFLDKARQRDIVFEPLGHTLSQGEKIAESAIRKSAVAGREGWVACQMGVSNSLNALRKSENHE